jgi:hypothetical protein
MIYEIRPNEIFPKYSLSFKNQSFPPPEELRKAEKSARNRNYVPWLSESGYIYSHNIIETELSLCVDYVVHKERYLGFYNKQNEQTYNYKLKQFQEVSGICGIEKIEGRSDDNCFVAVLAPSLIINQKNEIEFYSDKSKEIAENVKSTDNPILFLFRL